MIIPSILHKMLAECMRKISLNESKGGQLAINEWQIPPEDGIKISLTPGYAHYEINVVGVIGEKQAIRINGSNDFYNSLKQAFTVEELDIKETDNKRYNLKIILNQAVCIA